MAKRMRVASSRGILLLAMLVAGCIPAGALPGALTPGAPTRIPTLVEIRTPTPQSTRTATPEARWTQLAGTQVAVQQARAARGTELARTRQAGETLAARQATRRAQREREATGTARARASISTPDPTATSTAPLSKLNTPESRPTEQPQPVGTADPASAWQTCNSEAGGRQKVRVENKTGDTLQLYLSGAENYACSVEQGVQRIFVKSGTYQVTSVMCGGKRFDFGSHVLNPTWYINLKCP